MKVTLTAAEQTRLRQVMKQTASARLYRRLQAVFLAGEGHSATQIAAITGASVRSVQYWCATWRHSKEHRHLQKKALAEPPRLGRHLVVPALDRPRLLAEVGQRPVGTRLRGNELDGAAPCRASPTPRPCDHRAHPASPPAHAAGLRWKRPRFVFAEPEPHVAQKKGRSCVR
jgi:hypothetical protein